MFYIKKLNQIFQALAESGILTAEQEERLGVVQASLTKIMNGSEAELQK